MQLYHSIDDVIEDALNNNGHLTSAEIAHIFNNIVYESTFQRLNSNFDKIYNAIRYLLKTLRGTQHHLLINLINSDFKFEIRYNINTNFLDNRFLQDEICGYSYQCTNPETEKFLIDLAKNLQEKRNNSALDNFKNSFN